MCVAKCLCFVSLCTVVGHVEGVFLSQRRSSWSAFILIGHLGWWIRIVAMQLLIIGGSVRKKKSEYALEVVVLGDREKLK
jgi:putative Mn2+ efflux pump MntP